MNKAEAVASVVREFYPDNYSRWLNEKYVKNVLNYLGADEEPKAVIFGKSVGWVTRTSGSLWATNKRLLWVVSGGMTDYAYHQINKYSVSTNWILYGDFRMTPSNSQELIVDEVDKKAVTRFAEVVRVQMNNASAQAKSPQPSGQDIAAQLERLGQMKSQGLITEEEFKAAKAKLLAP